MNLSNKNTLSANCPNCGTGNDLFGGKRVKSLTCNYCGSVLDVYDNFKVIAQYQNMHRPFSPFKIGMNGKINDIDFEIIGTLHYIDSTDSWVEHQIFSATHGYAWLTWDDGHCLFSRKLRQLPKVYQHSINEISYDAINQADIAPSIIYQQQVFDYLESDFSRIIFVEGAFNYIAKANPIVADFYTSDKEDVSFYASFIKKDDIVNDSLMITYHEKHGQHDNIEREYYLTQYLDREETFQQFGVDKTVYKSKSHDIHILKPIVLSDWQISLEKVSSIMTVLALMMLIYYLFFDFTKTIFSEKDQSINSEIQGEFSVSNHRQVMEVIILSDMKNAWSEFEFEITDSNDNIVYEFSTELQYYEGYDDGFWKEGSQMRKIRFKVPQNGTYTITAKYITGQKDSNPSTQANLSINFSIIFNQGVKNVIWLLIFIIVTLLLLVSINKSKYIKYIKRRSAYDWER